MHISQFEDSFSNFIGVKDSITMNSCTSALEIALKVNKIRGEVIIPSMTWCATANAVVNAGAKPVFCDVGKTLNIDTTKIEALITKNTKAIMPVHLTGRPAKMDIIIQKHLENIFNINYGR